MYAGIGFEYLADADNYRTPQPFPSWTFDYTTWQWTAPVPYPADQTVQMQWIEDTQTWAPMPLPGSAAPPPIYETTPTDAGVATDPTA